MVREKSESNKGINTPFRGRYFIKILRNDLLPSPPAMEQELDDTKSPSIAAELARKDSELAYAKWKKATGMAVVLTNVKTKVSQEFDSMNQAAKMHNTSHKTLSRYIQNKKLFKGIYNITLK